MQLRKFQNSKTVNINNFFWKSKILLFYLDQIKKILKKGILLIFTLFFIYLDHTWFPILH